MKLTLNLLRSESATVVANAADAPTYKALLRTLESVDPKAAIRVIAGGRTKHGITDAGVFVARGNKEGAYYTVGKAAYAVAAAEDFPSVLKKAGGEGKFVVWEATDEGLPGKPVNAQAFKKWSDAVADFVSRAGGAASAAPQVVNTQPADTGLSVSDLITKLTSLNPDGYGAKINKYCNSLFGTKGLIFYAADNGADSALTVDAGLDDRTWFIVGDKQNTKRLARTLKVKAASSVFFAVIADGLSGDNPKLLDEFSDAVEAQNALSVYLQRFAAGEFHATVAPVAATPGNSPVSLDDLDMDVQSGSFDVKIDAKQISSVKVNPDIALTELDLGWLHDEIGITDSDKIGDRLSASKQIAQFIWRNAAKDSTRSYLYSVGSFAGGTAVTVESLPAARSAVPHFKLVLVTSSGAPKKMKAAMSGTKVALFTAKVNSAGAMQGTPVRVYAARNLREALQAMLTFVKNTAATA